MGRKRQLGSIVTAAVGAIFLALPAYAAGPYALDAHLDGITNGGNYSPSQFQWTNPFQATFTHTTDASSVELMSAAQLHQNLGTAVIHETLQGTAVVTLQMSGVHVLAVHEGGDVDNASGPAETVVLGFREVVYTFQPVTPVGQRNGPPVSFTWTRGRP